MANAETIQEKLHALQDNFAAKTFQLNYKISKLSGCVCALIIKTRTSTNLFFFAINWQGQALLSI